MLFFLPIFRPTTDSEPIPLKKEETDDTGCLSTDTKDTLKEMLDMELLKDPIFILFTISNIFTSIGFNVPYVFLVVRYVNFNYYFLTLWGGRR